MKSSTRCHDHRRFQFSLTAWSLNIIWANLFCNCEYFFLFSLLGWLPQWYHSVFMDKRKISVRYLNQTEKNKWIDLMTYSLFYRKICSPNVLWVCVGKVEYCKIKFRERFRFGFILYDFLRWWRRRKDYIVMEYIQAMLRHQG